MIEIGQDLHLVAKSTLYGFAAEARLDQFDRNLLAILFIVSFREVNSTHSAATDLAKNSVWTNAIPRLRNVVVEAQQRCIGCALFHQVAAGVHAVGQQQIDLRTEISVISASGIQKPSLSRSIQLHRFREEMFYLLPAFRGDEWPPMFSWRRSQSFAESHSRLVVAGDMPSTVETSSIVRPPKKRNSTIRVCCGSSAARSVKASSSAIRSTSRFSKKLTASSNETFVA